MGGKSGTYSYCAVAYLDNGEEITGAGSGSYESNGKHRWKTEGVVQLSNGGTVVAEGEIDLASRSWKGKISEK